MIPKNFDDINKEDIERLKVNKRQEDRYLEYKSELPTEKEKSKKGFLQEIIAFANTSGGDLLCGITEKKGVPEELIGLQINDIDKEILRLENMIRDGVSPRIQGIGIKPIDGFDKGPIILIRIPKSWNAPHMVTFQTKSGFYSRHNNRKNPMDITEIRNNFLAYGDLSKRIKEFRDERLLKIINKDVPIKLGPKPKTILHIIPVSSFEIGSHIDLKNLMGLTKHFIPILGRSNHRHYNIDGYISYEMELEDYSGAYCQLYRNGIIESVEADLSFEYENRTAFYSTHFEDKLIHATKNYLSGLKNLEVPFPIILMLSICGAHEKILTIDGLQRRFIPFDRSTLKFPEVIIEEKDSQIDKLLKPIFDALWNAAGYECSFNYDEDGNWNPKRR